MKNKYTQRALISRNRINTRIKKILKFNYLLLIFLLYISVQSKAQWNSNAAVSLATSGATQDPVVYNPLNFLTSTDTWTGVISGAWATPGNNSTGTFNG